MATYKEGCKDKAVVMAIQRAVGCTADGVWGPKTTEALKAWQRRNGLVADGVAGPKTLAKMGIGDRSATVATAQGISITNGFIWQHITRCQGRPIQYIAIHYTAGRSSRSGQAMAARGAFLQRAASADFVVDDAQVVQVNPEPRNYYCWAMGDKRNKWTGGATLYGRATNRNTVSIEICSTLAAGTSAQVPNHAGWSFSAAALDNARRLVRYLMAQYGIPRERVIRHYDASGKLCPGIVGWNDGPLYQTDGTQARGNSTSEKWREFWQSI